MVASPEPDEAASLEPAVFERPHRRRPRPEVVVEAVFRPLAKLVVRALLPLRVAPTAVVVGNALAGVGAAVAIARGQLVAAALLLQLKTLLDNADGQLARASGRITVLGRYLDTEADLVVNVALFAALAHEAGSPVLALVALIGLTLVLSADFNEAALHRRARGEVVVTEPSAAGEGSLARALARAYRVVFAPQDRAFQAIARRRLESVLIGISDREVRKRASLAYHDGLTTAILANFGLSTQLVALGLCLVLAAPTMYLWLVLGCAATLPFLQLRREQASRKVVRSLDPVSWARRRGA